MSTVAELETHEAFVVTTKGDARNWIETKLQEALADG